MRIVLVHGRAAQMEIPAIMEADMTRALAFGQARIDDGLDPASLDVHLAFYGDIWRPDLRQPLPVIEPAEEAEEAFPGVSDISLWVDEHLNVGDFLTEHMLKDVDDYMSDPDLRQQTNDRLRVAVRREPLDAEGVVVIGFSMGSFVAYDTLRASADLPVGALITIGSPLSMPSFYRRLTADSPIAPPANPTPFPPQLRLWANVWTKDDPATAGHADIAARYPNAAADGPRVQDLETWGRSAAATNPAAAHNALDYLSSRVFATALRRAVRLIRAGAGTP